ncbi:MAG: hypothetical protein ACLTXT_05115 [Ruminococcus callidus]
MLGSSSLLLTRPQLYIAHRILPAVPLCGSVGVPAENRKFPYYNSKAAVQCSAVAAFWQCTLSNFIYKIMVDGSGLAVVQQGAEMRTLKYCE